jgi:DNA-binding response OmpR family regulator
MLPTRAYVDNIPRMSPGGSATRPGADVHTALVVAVAEADVDHFPAGDFTRYPVRTTMEALRMIETARPRVVVIDWDAPLIDGPQVCSAARKFGQTGVLVAMQKPESAPAALKAGCHAILLKPFAPNLVAARIGRLSRELPLTPVAARAAVVMQQTGTNRVWPDTHCPQCNAPSATSFEFASYRRMWYACLGCDAVWLGPRQE